jgi:hypothetical protein
MTDLEILQTAIERASANGWRGVLSPVLMEGYDFIYTSGENILKMKWEGWHKIFTVGAFEDREEVRLESILFNHDFAKALWGESLRASAHGGSINDPEGKSILRLIPLWQYNLQEMVITDDPIKYLGEHL